MKSKLYLIICLLPLMAGTCKKESENCHRNIIIKNSSPDTVLYALKATLGIDPSKCSLDGYSFKPQSEIKSDLKYCWEDELSKGKTFEFYIVDPKLYNKNGFYDCDSIEIKNKVLKHYVLTLEDLKGSDFTVIYQ